MRSKVSKERSSVTVRLLSVASCCFLILTLTSFLFTFIFFNSRAEGAIFDRVAAFVDDDAITLSEFRAQYESTRKVSPDITGEDVITTMVNRLLLLREARKYRIEAPTKDEMIKDYIDLKVRAFIRVSENDIEAFYKENIDKFQGKELDDARAEIEKYLTERELNERLKKNLEELRKKAFIKIQLQPEA